MKKLYMLAPLLLLMTAFAGRSLHAATADVSWNTIDNGGGQSSGGNFSLGGTFGQPDAGFHSAGTTDHTGGFWGMFNAITYTPPVNTVPGTQNVNEDGNVNISGISVSDLTYGALSVSLHAIHGNITLLGTNGLTVSNNGTNTVFFNGTLTDLNTSFGLGVKYTPDSNFSGTDTITMVSFDNAPLPAQPQSDTDTFSVLIAPVADAPALTVMPLLDLFEGHNYQLDIASFLLDNDGSETLSSIQISGLPYWATLNLGTETPPGSGTYNLTQSDLIGLEIYLDDSGPITLTVTATATEATLIGNPGNPQSASTTVMQVLNVTNVNPTAKFVKADGFNKDYLGQVTFLEDTNTGNHGYDPSSVDAAVLRFAYDFDNDGSFNGPGEIGGTGNYADGSDDIFDPNVPTGYINKSGPFHIVHGRVIDKDAFYTDYYLQQPYLPLQTATTDQGIATLYTLKDVSGLPSFVPGTGSDHNPVGTDAMTVTITGAPDDPNIGSVDVLGNGKLRMVFHKGGAYTLKVKLSNPAGEYENYLVINAFPAIGTNGAPKITSGPSANPNPAYVGTTVIFSVLASDSNNDNLGYYWEFGDGTNSRDQNPSHVYTAKGAYKASVTVSDGNHYTGSKPLTVNILASTDNKFKITLMKISMNFATPGSDAIAFIAQTPVVTPFTPTGKLFYVRVGESIDPDRLEKTFTFVDTKRATITGDKNSLVTAKLTAANKANQSSSVQFTVDMRKLTNLFNSLDAMGFVKTTVTAKQKRDLTVSPVVIKYATGELLKGSIVVRYTSTIYKKGGALGKQ